MKNIFSKIILATVVACQSTLMFAMESQSNFENDIDKLILVNKAQTQYLENCTSLMKDHSVESQKFLENFIFPIGGKKLSEQRAIIDFHIDSIYLKIIELSLINLKKLKFQEQKGEISSDVFHSAISKLYLNIRRAHDITIGDVVKRGSDYLSSNSSSIKVYVDKENNKRSFDCDPNDLLSVYNIFVLTSLGKDYNNLSTHADAMKGIFQDDPVTLHYFNLVMNFEKISDYLSNYLLSLNNCEIVNKKRYFTPQIGKMKLIYDNVYKAVVDDNTSNTNIMLILALEETQESGTPLNPAQKKYLENLRIKYKRKNTVDFLQNEASFIDQQLAAIFPSNKPEAVKENNNSGWGSNPVMDQFNKKNSNNKTPRKKQQTKHANIKKQPTIKQVKKPEIAETVVENLLSIVEQKPSSALKRIDSRELQSVKHKSSFFQDLALAYDTEAYSFIIKYLDIKTLCSLICADKNIHPYFIEARNQIRISEIEYGEEVFDFDEWYKDNVTNNRHKKQFMLQSSIPNTSPPKPQFYGLGDTFLDVIFGHGYAEVTTKHFNSFLKQAGGYKVKMSQNGYISIPLKDKSVEAHYVVPNLLETRNEMPFCLFLVHQPHAASIPFPKKTLYNFLKRDLVKAGYTR